jgi:SAM-dependent methyltransferase
MVERLIRDHPAVRIRLLRLPHKGKGNAVATGLRTATTAVAAFCDLDLSTPLPELARLVDAAASSSVMIIGSRGTMSSRITRHQEKRREALGRLYNRVVQLSLVPGVVDTQCGAKAAATEIWRRVLPLCRESGFAWDVELVASARAMGVSVQEIGIEWEHKDGTRIHLWRDGVRMLAAIPRIRRRLRHKDLSRPRAKPSEVALDAATFDHETPEWVSSVDPTHWWLRNQATFVAFAIRRYARTGGWLVDIGAGPADVTAMLGWPPERTLALEKNVQLAKETQRRHAVVPLACDTEQPPLAAASATVVCLLDVIEHVADPIPTIRAAVRLLGPDGRLIVNVPAHPWLWSRADEVLGHTRRYTVATLKADLERGGCEVVWISHVFSWLVVPVWLRRRVLSSAEPQLGLDTSTPLIDRLSMLLTRLEWLVVSRLRSPLGTSVLCVARADRAASPAGTDVTQT